MDDQDREKTTDVDETPVTSLSEHDLHSEDSRNSEDSYLFNNDDEMDDNYHDFWGSDSYYNESTEDDSKFGSFSIIPLDTSQEENVAILENVPPVVEMIDETLEENNNDPNNNMDLSNLDYMEGAAGPVPDLEAERSRQRKTPDIIYVDRAQSPKPGCSKDSEPPLAPLMPINTSSTVTSTLVKTRDILKLVSKIQRDSVFDALCKYDKVPIEELKIWDLLPDEERREYSKVQSEQVKSGEISPISPEKASKSLDDDSTMQMEWTVTNNGVKRGPAGDICTVQPKKTSSDPDLTTNTISSSLPRVSSTSQIPDFMGNIINLGAIPKVRGEPPEKRASTPIEAWNALVSEAQRSVPMDDYPILKTFRPIQENSKPETISRMNEAQSGQTEAKLDEKSGPSSSVVRAPMLKYSVAKSTAGKEDITELDKSKPSAFDAVRSATVMPKAVSPSSSVATVSINPQRTRRLPVPTAVASGSVPLRKPVATVAATNTRAHQQTQMETGNRYQAPVVAATLIPGDSNYNTEPVNRLKQPASVTPAPIHQQRQPETANRQKQPTPTIAPVAAPAPIIQQRQPETAYRQLAQTTAQLAAAAAAALINQQRQPETANRQNHTTGAPRSIAVAPTINQQRQLETVNRPEEPGATIAPLAAPINQQRPMNMGTFQVVPPPIGGAATAGVNYPTRQTEIQQPLQLQGGPMQPLAQAKEQSTKRIICKEMYYKLRNIFPNVDRKYIKKLCPPDWGPGDKDTQMAPIIEHLLEAGETLPQEQPIDHITEQALNNFSYKSADDLYEFFIGIFPDADPHYLRDFAEKNLGIDEAIKNFVDSNLERRDYPTREEYMARLKITEQQRRYTTGFEVKQFLSIIPDPSKHFMDAQRKCTHQTVAFEFLKNHFKKLRVATISRAYSQNRYNLSLAAHSLENLPDELKSKRWGYEMPTEDILLLQEIAFVKHKADINKYIAQVKKTEDEEFRTLKAMNQLLECQCCFDSECVPSKCSECDNGHIFCNSCVITGTSAKMGEDQTRIYCFINCGSEFSLSALQRVLAPTTFSILLKKRQAAEVIEAGLDGLVSCPFCHFASIPPEGDKIFKCLNPECTKESCRLCKELSHVPLKCDEITKTENARLYIEEKMTEALARKCYKCNRSYFKEEGCNKINCPCGAIMCYLCDQPIKDYTHFRGQGSNARTLCPLYSDTIRLDAVAVRKVAEDAKRQILQRNPNINIDTAGLLPDIPRPRDGPHNHVYNADELPLRAQRVLDLPPL